jgi:hypothetical protein
LQVQVSPPVPAASQAARWSDSRVPYLVVALVVLLLLSLQTLNRQWSTDYYMYAATTSSLHADLTDPRHEMTGSDDASEHFTPYTLALAAVERGTGLAPIRVLQLAAIANLVAFLIAFELFVVELTRRRLVAAFALVATLVMWGLRPWRWSGFLNLNSIGFEAPWPATLVIALVLFAGWALLRYDQSGSSGWLIVAASCMAVGLLSHPYTAGWGVLMLGALVVHRQLWRRGRIIPLAIAGVCVAVAVIPWPYFPFLELGAHGDSAYSGVMGAMYKQVPIRLVAAIPGFVVVVQRFRRDHTDPLALMLFAGSAVYVLGWLLDVPSFGRALPLILLSAHIGIGVLVADLVERRVRATPFVVAGLALCFVIGFIGIVPGLVRTVPRALLPPSYRDTAEVRAIDDQFSEMKHALPFGTVVLAERDRGLSAVAPAFGMKVVSPGYPSVFVADVRARERATAEFLAPQTTEAIRRRIAARYDVRAVLCSTERCKREFRPGGVIARGTFWELLRYPVQTSVST